MKVYEIHDNAGIDSLALVKRLILNQDMTKLWCVRAVSLSGSDYTGGKSAGRKLNVIPMSDGAGEVVAVGEGGDTVKVGDRVAGTFFKMGEWSSLRK